MSSLRLAVYGKGGIGKSTLSANLAAAFALMGKKVLLLGCDPKHDSTRLLLDGQSAKPVLDYLSEGGRQVDLFELERRARERGSVASVVAEGLGLPKGLTRESILSVGFGGVHCVEAGGPIPGVGCAGRGLLSLFALLELLNINAKDYDVVLYDVLGDVVCGGFAVPLRADRANRVLLVSSEEYLALYAANNLLRAVASFDGEGARLAGLILNRRENTSDLGPAHALLDRLGLPCLTELPRSEIIREAERAQKPFVALFPESVEAQAVMALAHHLLSDPPVVKARPLSVAELERDFRPVSGRQKLAGLKALRERAQVKRAPLPKQSQPLRLAIYGKGGIGKSTLSANLAAALAERGLKVLLVGCDPKQDSTNLLRGGQSYRTVLEYLQDTVGQPQSLSEVVKSGYGQVDCVESGGPQPGVGCAGRGILSAFNLMEKLGLDESQYDAILYDVVGDVVCGGFALPLRKGYAQAALLVSSEEYLSLYAANHLLRGMSNMLGTTPALLGLIHNVRDNHGDFSGLENFLRATDLPLYGRIPRSPVIREAEALTLPVSAAFPASDEAALFHDLAERLLNALRVPPRPLDEVALEKVALHGEALMAPAACDPHTMAHALKAEVAQGDRRRHFRRGFQFTDFEAEPEQPFFYREPPRRQPIWGCAFNGALMQALTVRDAVVVAHAPQSCTHMRRVGLAGSAAKSLKRRREHLPDPMVPNLIATDMDEQQMIHGGNTLLVASLREAVARRPKLVYLVTACPSAIIGDDVAAAVAEVQKETPEIPIVTLRSDGNMTGGSFNGMLSGLFDGLLEQVDPPEASELRPKSVNLILDRDKDDSADIKALLARLGIEVNTSFSEGRHDLKLEDLRHFHRAPVTLLSITGALDPMMRQYLAELNGRKGGGELSPYCFPRGRFETERWLRWLGARFGVEANAEAMIAEGLAQYQAEIAPYRAALKGKRLAVFWGGGPLEWLLDTVLDLEMEPVVVGIMAREDDAKPFLELRHQDRLRYEFSFHPMRRFEVLNTLKPDAVLTGPRHDLPMGPVYLDLIGTGNVGFLTGVQAAKRWHALFRCPPIEGWRQVFHQKAEVTR